MLGRRAFSLALFLGGIITSVAVEAQQAAKIARIGWLGSDRVGGLATAFLQGLRDLGYVEGRNVVIEYRTADGQLERLPALATELVSLKVDVIVTQSTVAALAAKQATRIIPIVFGAVSDPVETGLIASFAQPGGNVTGSSFFTPELVGKSLQLLKQTVPGVSRVAVLWQPAAFAEPQGKALLEAAELAARTLGVRLHVVGARRPDDFGKAFSDMTRARVNGLAVLSSPMFNTQRSRLVDLAAKNRLPAVYPWRGAVDAGGLMAYGPNARVCS